MIPTLRKEEQFYGVEMLGDGKWERVIYEFDPDIRTRVDSYDHVAIGNFFVSVSAPILDFAERSNSRIEKYYKDAPFWMLQFYHPEGGLGRIDVFYKHANIAVFRRSEVSDLALLDPSPKLSISSMWRHPDFETRFDVALPTELASPIDPVALREALEKHYATLLELKR